MLTKYIIKIGNQEHELTGAEVKNWDQIKCSFKRSDYGGIVRSFTSQFEFVGEAYKLMIALYLRDRFNAQATLEVYTITDRWEWEKQFECPFDFSTISWTATTLKIGCIDTSLAALIKANKGTKYEFLVGTDIKPDGLMQFNRLPIMEDLTYAYTGGTTLEEDGSLVVSTPQNERVFMGLSTEAHITINEAVKYNDDQTEDANSYLFEVIKDLKVKAEIEIVADKTYGSTQSILTSTLCVLKSDGQKSNITSITVGNSGKVFVGSFDYEELLTSTYTHDMIVETDVYGGKRLRTEYWALVNNIVYEVQYLGSIERSGWVNTKRTEKEYRRDRRYATVSLTLKKGDKVYVRSSGTGHARIFSSKFQFGWITKGKPLTVDTFSPQAIAGALLKKNNNGTYNISVEMSDHDGRLANTRIFAAESIRGLNTAKLYSSFNEFTEWMEAVFGYVYYLGGSRPSKFVNYQESLIASTNTPYTISDKHWYADSNTNMPTAQDIQYLSAHGKFVAYNGSKWYSMFPGDTKYNDPATGKARTDTVFLMKVYKSGGGTEEKLVYFDGNSNAPIDYPNAVEDIFKPEHSIHFVHRSELFGNGEQLRRIERVRDVQYTVDSGSIYSSVEAGYEKKDYEGICGRDEFNFSNTYTTNCMTANKALTLKSKYRADGYGMEFAAQKRGKDTTDSTSDKDVFFVHCAKDGGSWKPDTSLPITNAVSTELINGAFSPMACIRANAGLIGLQSDNLTLTFASSTGNAEVSINGEKMSASITLNTPLATCGEIQFTTDDIKTPSDLNELVEVEYDGTTYQGYISELDLKFAKSEASKYKLIVKSIQT